MLQGRVGVGTQRQLLGRNPPAFGVRAYPPLHPSTHAHGPGRPRGWGTRRQRPLLTEAAPPSRLCSARSSPEGAEPRRTRGRAPRRIRGVQVCVHPPRAGAGGRGAEPGPRSSSAVGRLQTPEEHPTPRKRLGATALPRGTGLGGLAQTVCACRLEPRRPPRRRRPCWGPGAAGGRLPPHPDAG